MWYRRLVCFMRRITEIARNSLEQQDCMRDLYRLSIMKIHQPNSLTKGAAWRLKIFSILGIYHTLTIINASLHCDKQERSHRGMALLNHTYKSLYTEDYPSCLKACMSDPQCMSFNYWWNVLKCDLNNRTKYSAVEKVFIRDISSTYMGLIREPETTMYRSCRDVPPSNGDGEYFIDPTLSGNPFTVYCDMTTDGGGWTAIHLIQFKESNLRLETSSSLASSYKSLSSYNDHRQIVLPVALFELKNDMGFKQIRFYCHKKKVGTVVHIMTNISPLGKAAVMYFINFNPNSTRPQACGSYTVLPDDNSTLSEDCSMLGWNGTHPDGKWTASSTKGQARIYRPLRRGLYAKRYAFTSSPLNRNCDGNKNEEDSISAGDTWAVFVR